MDWSGVDYLWIIVVFISCLDSHSDGTHSLQRIHWWASDAMLHFSKSDEKTTSWNACTFFSTFTCLGELYLSFMLSFSCHKNHLLPLGLWCNRRRARHIFLGWGCCLCSWSRCWGSSHLLQTPHSIPTEERQILCMQLYFLGFGRHIHHKTEIKLQ